METTKSPASPDALVFAYQHATAVVREHDRDRYYATLFAPVDRRPYLFALYAFNIEIARIRDAVSDPLPGEVRLQWWRDFLSGEARGESSANPLAVALLDAIRLNRLPIEPFIALIDAHSFDLYDDPMPTWNDLEGYCAETSSALMRLACIVLASGEDPGGAAEVGHAGVAVALSGLLRNFAWHAAQGRTFLPEDLLERHGIAATSILTGADSLPLRAALAEIAARARHHLAELFDGIGQITPVILPALLPVVLVDPYLRQMDRKNYRPFESRIAMADWKMIFYFWRSSRQGLC